jgi:hypothetical protein
MKYPLIYGAIAGAIIVALTGIMMSAGGPQHSTSPLFGYLVMLAALSLIFVGVKRYRDVELGGVIKFGRAFLLGLGIAAVAAAIYVAAWEVVMATGVGGDYIAQYVDAYAREMQAGGASAAEVAAMRADMASFQEAYQNPLFRMLITLSEIAPVGLLVALVTALILRNPRVLPAQRA